MTDLGPQPWRPHRRRHRRVGRILRANPAQPAQVEAMADNAEARLVEATSVIS
jgi:hypothetical protein